MLAQFTNKLKPSSLHRLPHILLSMSCLILSALSSPSYAQSCPPAGYSEASLQELKQKQWELKGDIKGEIKHDLKVDAKRQQLAFALLSCLASPNPHLRDEIAFEALSFWMRNKLLDTATVRKISQKLLTQIADTQASPNADFSKPFAALTLAEVVRVDRLQAFMTEQERSDMVNAAAQFLSGVKDYRGFDEKEGWRHGVAHGADWMLQLALNPQLKAEQHQVILQALATQINNEQHFYIFGEPERMMAPVFFLALRSPLDDAAWQAWFEKLIQGSTNAAPMNTQASLARRHNLKAFLQALYVNVHESKQERIKEKLQPLIVSSLKKLN
ncbi:DUF2785 domain-containing protein [Undibacterium cyanobacteriorum]|uniref:DUF2785 domain-containing protein n=1 Tax=Undibacterium cyanobacteriorum TaxID=3073561 RepID=A0ABY9RL22_9BURK|nr:DUF2785 domain-containing protein [Undibacterium sp. 20NA77.5]WMW81918.1 DUF2785 domain-containing protein [Undibacterium sp. 20NA77.5]